jgi:hypothetical protein
MSLAHSYGLWNSSNAIDVEKQMRMVIVMIMSLALGFWIAANSFVSPETILNVIRH